MTFFLVTQLTNVSDVYPTSKKKGAKVMMWINQFREEADTKAEEGPWHTSNWHLVEIEKKYHHIPEEEISSLWLSVWRSGDSKYGKNSKKKNNIIVWIE